MRCYAEWIYETVLTALRPVNQGPMTTEQVADLLLDRGISVGDDAEPDAESILSDLRVTGEVIERNGRHQLPSTGTV